MRLQEFYESPYPEIRGHYFTHEQYMDMCAHGSARSTRDEVIFTYFEDWSGFNIPGHVFKKWVNLFSKKGLWEKEKKLVELITQRVGKSNSKFYVIGTYKSSDASVVVDHELSHAWYYLDSTYRRDMQKNIKSLNKTSLQQVRNYITNMGYDKSVLDDETAAYLATSSMVYINKMFGTLNPPWQKVFNFQKTFDTYKEKNLQD